MQSIVLGGGCFWCLDASFRLINGVTEVISGYSGGNSEDANYNSVSSGLTNHAEVVKVTFNESIISLEELLDLFWAIHDPTTKDKQGNDVGPQYRSVIYYNGKTQKTVAEKSISKIAGLWDDPIVTKVQPLKNFYPAEDYHQNYFQKNPGNGYCQVIINPKLSKLRLKFAEKIKS